MLKPECQFQTAGRAQLFLMKTTSSLTAVCPFSPAQLQDSSCWPEHLGASWEEDKEEAGLAPVEPANGDAGSRPRAGAGDPTERLCLPSSPKEELKVCDWDL